MAKKEKVLTPEKVIKLVTKRLKPLDKLSFLERYAVFMGKAQIVELGMKGLLVSKYGFDLNDIEKWTLGRTITQLKSSGLRPDFIQLLEELLQYRNEFAHEYLSLTATGSSLAGPEFRILQEKQLRYALFKVEEVIQVHDFLLVNDFF